MFKNSELEKEWKKTWYRENIQKISDRHKNKLEDNKKWLYLYKSTLKCEMCPENHPAALDFHHKDSSEKENTVSNMIHSRYSLNTIIKEISKCTVLCANCHRKIHYVCKK